MSNSTIWSVMLVDDELDVCSSLKELIEGEHLTDRGDTARVTPVSDFGDALSILESGRFDLAILDVRHGDLDAEAGRTLQQRIANVRFVPIIFHTGWPEHVRELENTPFIQIVAKGDNPEKLLGAIRTVFSGTLPAVNRALIRHVDRIQRDYMWEFVAKNWTAISGQGDRVSIAYLLARRLATSLSDASISQFAGDLAGPSHVPVQAGRAHPMQFYVMPPLEEPSSMAGDIYKGTLGAEDGYWALLTPTCDLVQGKAEWLVLAACCPLSEQEEYRLWEKNGTGLQKLRRLLANNRTTQPDRFFYLPGALSVPSLVVDLQRVVSILRGDFNRSRVIRLATLDSPFAEALASRFTRFFGRVGMPDLDTDLVIKQLSRPDGQE